MHSLYTSLCPMLQQPETGQRCCPLQSGTRLVMQIQGATEHFFSPMPWTAMPHLASMGARGQELMTTFSVTTIPALVLIDGKGAIVCLDGQRKITEDPAGLGFPSGTVVASRLPPYPQRQPRQERKPSGTPPTFGGAPQVAAAVYMGPPTQLPIAMPTTTPTVMPTCSCPPLVAS
jgi:hypothetical protein